MSPDSRSGKRILVVSLYKNYQNSQLCADPITRQSKRRNLPIIKVNKTTDITCFLILARSGLAARVSFHKAKFRILNTRYSCKAGFILSFNIIALDYLEYFRIM